MQVLDYGDFSPDFDDDTAPTPAFTADAPAPATTLAPEIAAEPAVEATLTVVVATAAVVATTAQPLQTT